MATLRPLRLHGHLGSSVSALVDGQLDPESAERAWQHVEQCPPCRRLVEHEGWVKRQLAHIGDTPRAETPSDRFVGALLELDPTDPAWTDTTPPHDRGRTRRRAGIALVGASSVSAAVLGLSTLSGAPMSLIGGNGTPATSIGGASSPASTPGTAPSSMASWPASWLPASPSAVPSSWPSSRPETLPPTLPVVAPTAAARGQLPGYPPGTEADGVVRGRLAFFPR